jgi:photosystem II stability/assembly factor-like uncharacterized protein
MFNILFFFLAAFLLQVNLNAQLYISDINICGDTWWVTSFLPDTTSTSVIQKSNDFGKNWTIVQSLSGDTHFYSTIEFIDSLNGWVIMQEHITGIGILLKTTNGGINWENTGNSFNSSFDFYYLDFKDKYNGLVMDKYFVHKTTDGGITFWNATPFFPSDVYNAGIRSISAPSDSVIYVVDLDIIGTWEGEFSYYSLFRTSDQGNTWSEQIKRKDWYFTSDFFSSDSGFIFRSMGRDSSWAYYTADKGETLDSVNFIPRVRGSKFFNRKYGFVAGSNVLYKTTDGLQSFDTVFVADADFITDFMFSNNIGLLVAHKIIPHTHRLSYIYYTTDSGQTWNEPVVSRGENTEPVSQFILYQNYPNPFNPTTTFKFSLPHQENVKLDIYDVLGNKITSLLNEEMNAGEHRVQYNASDLASGVYIYRISAGKNFSAKKFIVIK